MNLFTMARMGVLCIAWSLLQMVFSSRSVHLFAEQRLTNAAVLNVTRDVNEEYILAPGDNVQAIVANAAEGAQFWFRPGIYYVDTISPKDNQKFIGDTGATLSGSRTLSMWQYDSAIDAWFVMGQTPQNTLLSGECLVPPGFTSYTGCRYPNDLWLDSHLQWRVTSLGELASGRWYWETATDRLYVKDDPRGHVVELSMVAHAFQSNSASGVRIENLIIEKFANPAQQGALEAGDAGAGGRVNSQPVASNWTVMNNEIRSNHGAGLRIGNGWVVANNFIHHNGQIGITGGGRDSLVEANEIAYNNTLGFDPGWEAGGTKFAWTTHLRVAHNYSHHNRGPGLWTDADNRNVTYEGNQVLDNTGAGLSHEISFECLIRNNTFQNNGNSMGWVWDGGIVLQNSSNCVVSNNNVEVRAGAGNGITIVQQNRGLSASYGIPLLSNHNWVSGNTVRYRGATGVSGLGGDFQTDEFARPGNNVYTGNQYYVNATGRDHWHNVRGAMNWTSWRSQGQDPGGQELIHAGAELAVTALATYLPGGRIGTPYQRSLQAVDGASPFAWAVSSGALPLGFTVSPSGLLYGLPRTAGRYRFVVQVTDAAGQVDTQPLALVISPARR